MNNNPNPMIATKAGIRAVRKVGSLAKKQKVTLALVSGIALHFTVALG